MRLNLVAAAYALWFVATEVLFYVYYTGGDDQSIQQISVILGLIPAALQILLLGFNTYGLVTPVRMALCFLLIVLISYLGNAYWTSLVFLGSVVFIFAIAILVASSPDERLIRSIAVFYTVPAALFLLYVTATGEHVWGRLEAHGITADWWGLMGAGLATAALAHRSRLLAVFCIGAGFYVTYDASARGNMLTIILSLLVVGCLTFRALRGVRLVATIAILGAALAVWALFSSQIGDTVTRVVAETMHLHDPNRGLNSGLTGRTDVWENVLQVWLKSPLFGVGFHQHTMVTSDHAPAHSAYLAALADTGIFGLIWYVCFVIVSFLASLRISDRRTRNAAVATIVAYAMIGLFDARGLNSGNPASLYFAMCCFFALRRASIERVFKSISDSLHSRARQPADAA